MNGTEKQTFWERIKSIKTAQLFLPLVLLFVFAGAIVGIVNYQSKNKIPKLEITSPADGAEVSDAQIVVTGKTDSKNKISVNQKETRIDKKGGFYVETPLSYGKNSINVVAENKAGRKTEKNLLITRKTDLQTSGTTPVIESANPNTVAQSSPQPQAVTQPDTSTQTVIPSGDGKGNLSTSGPETFWLLESATLSAAGVAFGMSRKKFKDTLRK